MKEEKLMSKDQYDKECQKKDIAEVDGFLEVKSAVDGCFANVCGRIIDGEVVFSYVKTDGKGDLYQVIVSRDYDIYSNTFKNPSLFNIILVTVNYTTVLRNIPFTYLERELFDELEDFGVDENTLGAFKGILEDIKGGSLDR